MKPKKHWVLGSYYSESIPKTFYTSFGEIDVSGFPKTIVKSVEISISKKADYERWKEDAKYILENVIKIDSKRDQLLLKAIVELNYDDFLKVIFQMKYRKGYYLTDVSITSLLEEFNEGPILKYGPFIINKKLFTISTPYVVREYSSLEELTL
jgi:hypothetical protein